MKLSAVFGEMTVMCPAQVRIESYSCILCSFEREAPETNEDLDFFPHTLQIVGYGACVVKNMNNLQKDQCQKEFMQLRQCAGTAIVSSTICATLECMIPLSQELSCFAYALMGLL